MKKIVPDPPKNPDPSVFRFYCPPNNCWCMSDDICVKSIQRIIRAQSAKRTIMGRPDVNLEGMPHVLNCMECEKGQNLMEEMTRKSKNRRRPPKPKPIETTNLEPKKRGRKPSEKGPCSWPGCRNKAQQYGLCRNHCDQALRNCLIKPNTQTNTHELTSLIPVLAEMAKKSGKPVGEVAYRAMVEGVSRYLSRSKTGG